MVYVTTIKSIISKTINTLKPTIINQDDVIIPYDDAKSLKEKKQSLSILLRVKSNVTTLKEKLEQNKKEALKIINETQTDQQQLQDDFDQFWNDHKIDELLDDTDQFLLDINATLEEYKVNIELDLLTQSTQNTSISQSNTTTNANPTQSFQLINSSTQAPVTQQINQTTQQNVVPSIAAVSNQNNQFHLPGIKITPFDGTLSKFNQFWSTFNCMIHSNTQVSDVEKLLHLQTLLVGRAARIMEYIEFAPDNYNLVVKELHERFGNSLDHKRSLNTKLDNIPFADESAINLRDTFDSIRTIINQLTRLDNELESTRVADIVRSKFPESIQQKATRYMYQSKNTYNTSNLINALHAIIKEEEAVQQVTESSLTTIKQTTINVTTNQNAQCVFCKRYNHLPEQCKVITSKIQKRNILKQNNIRCWICFTSEHNSSSCNRRSCYSCGEKHHTSICLNNRPSNTQNDTVRIIPNHNSRNLNRNNKNHTYSDNTTSLNTHTNKFNTKWRVHFSPHSRPIDSRKQLRYSSNSRTREHSNSRSRSRSNSNGHRKSTVNIGTSFDSEQRKASLMLLNSVIIGGGSQLNLKQINIILDTAAQDSFIKADLATQLELETLSTEKINISTFCEGNITENSQKVVATLMNKKLEKIQLHLNTIKKLTSTLSTPNLTPDDEAYLRDRGFEYGVTSGRRTKPEILIGMDNFWKIVDWKKGNEQLPSGMILSHTFLGPVISGPVTIDQDFHSINHTNITP